MNMPADDFLTVFYVIIDDWYQENGAPLLSGKPGAKPLFSDSEVLVLAIAQPFFGVRSEREWVRRVRKNWKHLFPDMLSQSEYNRRVRMLWHLLEQLRRYLVEKLEVRGEKYRIVDSAPVHLRHWRRYGPGHLMLEDATLGYCAAKQETFYGYRLVLLITLDGVPTDWLLIPANGSERDAATEMLQYYRGLVVLGDKGFVDEPWQRELAEQRDTHVLNPKRCNQKEQNPAWLDALIGRYRRLVETAFGQLAVQLNMEHPGARTLWGVHTRMRAILAGLTLAIWFNKQTGNNLLSIATFEI